jgi:hypothetical protein
MSIIKYLGCFDMVWRTDKLTRVGDPLVELNQRIDWEAFREALCLVYGKPRNSNVSAKPIDVMLMSKVLVLQ